MKLYYVMHPNATKVSYNARGRKWHKAKSWDTSVCNCVIDRVGIDTDDSYDVSYLLNRGEHWLCGNCFTREEKRELLRKVKKQSHEGKDISSGKEAEL